MGFNMDARNEFLSFFFGAIIDPAINESVKILKGDLFAMERMFNDFSNKTGLPAEVLKTIYIIQSLAEEILASFDTDPEDDYRFQLKGSNGDFSDFNQNDTAEISSGMIGGDGEVSWITQFSEYPRMNLVWEDGKPSHFKFERSEGSNNALGKLQRS